MAALGPPTAAAGRRTYVFNGYAVPCLTIKRCAVKSSRSAAGVWAYLLWGFGADGSGGSAQFLPVSAFFNPRVRLLLVPGILGLGLGLGVVACCGFQDLRDRCGQGVAAGGGCA